MLGVQCKLMEIGDCFAPLRPSRNVRWASAVRPRRRAGPPASGSTHVRQGISVSALELTDRDLWRETAFPGSKGTLPEASRLFVICDDLERGAPRRMVFRVNQKSVHAFLDELGQSSDSGRNDGN